jgi:hypothetical protein
VNKDRKYLSSYNYEKFILINTWLNKGRLYKRTINFFTCSQEWV